MVLYRGKRTHLSSCHGKVSLTLRTVIGLVFVLPAHLRVFRTDFLELHLEWKFLANVKRFFNWNEPGVTVTTSRNPFALLRCLLIPVVMCSLLSGTLARLFRTFLSRRKVQLFAFVTRIPVFCIQVPCVLVRIFRVEVAFDIPRVRFVVPWNGKFVKKKDFNEIRENTL